MYIKLVLQTPFSKFNVILKRHKDPTTSPPTLYPTKSLPFANFSRFCFSFSHKRKQKSFRKENILVFVCDHIQHAFQFNALLVEREKLFSSLSVCKVAPQFVLNVVISHKEYFVYVHLKIKSALN